MWSDDPPSGREQAIETLVDMEPHGSYYRASRIMEESVPQGLLNRPSLITKAALVEQAYALSKYEIDQVSKYDTFLETRPRPLPLPTSILSQDRILRHHAKILKAKRGSAPKSPLAPSRPLVSALRQVYGEGKSESQELRSLLQSLVDLSKTDDISTALPSEEQPNHPTVHLESLVANLCSNDTPKLRALLVSILSLVSGYEVADSSRAEEGSDPVLPPSLQVGSLLSLITPSPDDDSREWTLDADILTYLGQAAAAYEERIERQKHRLLAQLDAATPPVAVSDGFRTPTAETSSVVADPTEPMTPQGHGAVVIPDDAGFQDYIEAVAALSADDLERAINAAARDDSSEEEDDHDSYSEESEQNGSEPDSSSSSSSSSSSFDVDPGDSEPHPNLDDENDAEVEGDDDDDDDDVLHQETGLEVSSDSIRIDTARVGAAASPDSGVSSDPVSVQETPLSKNNHPHVSEPEESPLPSLPPAPKSYPFARMLSSTKDEDEPDTGSPYLDPSALNSFGALPASSVLVHLLLYALEVIQSKTFGSEIPSSNQGIESTIAGGVGCNLFPLVHSFVKPHQPSEDAASDVAVPLQMLVSLFLLVADRRADAIENLKGAISQQSRSGESFGEGRKDTGQNTPTSEEEDDPAIALALHYLDKDAAETKESLAAKGMRRKAAAAAHDAAALQKSLQRRTDAWKQQVKLFSLCALLAMKSLRQFLHSIVRRWLEERQGINATDCHELLPRTVLSKLSMVLSSFCSATAKNSNFGSVVGTEEELEQVFMSLKCYQESLLLWGEVVPVIHPSVESQSDLLKSLIASCSKSTVDNAPRAVEKVVSWPSEDAEVALHKLQVLCRRLRASDLLDSFVSSPACYLPDDGNSTSESGLPKQEPHCASSLLSLISSAFPMLGRVDGELQNFFLALCHRCHVRVLLWDGLFSCTEGEADDTAMSLTQTAGDTVKIGTGPPGHLVFDPTKCSDSMTILSQAEPGNPATSGNAVHQRASKVWGTALSSACYAPKTGVHRWAVRLDKCERGHVFVGVATSQATTRTYVGGDRYGWGMIGTQALWHDRRKIRGDYGATFRTGSTIIVTLDTDAGTLSFSSWKDHSSSSSFSLDPSVQGLSSPRRQGHASGTTEDWGVAFEGLPLDSKLFPAVGLYGRDDRVTLLTVESGLSSGSRDGVLDQTGGMYYYPRADDIGIDADSTQLQQIQTFNNHLAWDGIEYASAMLSCIVEQGLNGDDGFMVTELLPSLAASLALVPPSIPILSQRCALSLIPQLSNCILEMRKWRVERSIARCPFQQGLQQGKWMIRATGSAGSGGDPEEYLVGLIPTVDEQGTVVGFEGTGVGTTGKSKNGLVAIIGTVKGSAINFVEEWTDGNDDGLAVISSDETTSTCVVTGRLSLDGTKFEGTYRNVEFGTTGQLAGILSPDSRKISKIRLKEAPASAKQSAAMVRAVATSEALMYVAHSHFVTMLAEDSAADFSCRLQNPGISSLSGVEWKAHYANLQKCLALPILSIPSSGSSETVLWGHANDIRNLYASPQGFGHDPSFKHQPIREKLILDCVSSNKCGISFVSFENFPESDFLAMDEVISRKSGVGSLAALSKESYDSARKKLICLFLHHCGLTELLGQPVALAVPTILEDVWMSAVKTMEAGIREALSQAHVEGSAREKARGFCERCEMICDFLLSMESVRDRPLSLSGAVSDLSMLLASTKCLADIDILRTEVSRASKRALLRLVAISETGSLLENSAEHEIEGAEEGVIAGVAKLLGRGTSVIGTAEQGDLGGHYLSYLPGASWPFRAALGSSVRSLWATLSSVLRNTISRFAQTGSHGAHSRDSQVLTILVAFTTPMHESDLNFVLVDCKLLSTISELLDIYYPICVSSVSTGGTDIAVVKNVSDLSTREVARSIVKAAVSVSHVISYQVLQNCSQLAHSGLPECLALVVAQLSRVVELVENAVKVSTKDSRRYLSDKQWEKWLESQTQDTIMKTPVKQRRPHRQVGHSGVTFLQSHGMAQTGSVPCSAQKAPPRSRSQGFGTSSDVPPAGVVCTFTLQLLSQWIHIFVGVSKVHLASNIVAKNLGWMTSLFMILGIQFPYDGTEPSETPRSPSRIPSRFRSRIIRLLFPLINQQDPSSQLVYSLFVGAGNYSMLLGEDVDCDGTISRELVTLLRQLHSPQSPGWRKEINAVIRSILYKEWTDAVLASKLGVLLFFNGGFSDVARGSFVLLKPAASASLSSEQQGASSGKSHSGSGSSTPSVNPSTPHHIAGNGTEGIVAGLCRHDAAAGIVSNIDFKNGVCEVILLIRETEDSRNTASCRNPKPALTVRALRSPLADCVRAQEEDLFLYDTNVAELTISALDSALKFVLESGFGKEIGSIKEIGANIRLMSFAAMTIKASISILTDGRLNTLFSSDTRAKQVFSNLLRVANMNEHTFPSVPSLMQLSPPPEFLSSLPVHEARWVHLVKLFQNLEVHEDVLSSTDETTWKKRLRVFEQRIREQETDESNSSGKTGSRNLGAVSSEVHPSSEDADVDTSAAASSVSAAAQPATEGETNNDDDDSEGTSAAASQRREVAIAQMAELGLPRSWSELALRRTGGANVEAAVHFCLERGGEMERLLAEERERERMAQRQSSGGSSIRRRISRDTAASNQLLRQLMEMGFPSRWCAEALAATGNNVDEALTWILTNGERLNEEDRGLSGVAGENLENGNDDDDDDDDDSQDDDSDLVSATTEKNEDDMAHESDGPGKVQGWSGSVIPLRFISGRSIIDPQTLAISGLPSGGFSSVGTKGVLLTAGKWYYEAILETAGCLQIGWADGSFAGHCDANRGDGCGDGPSSWAYDGWRRYRWHSTATEWGCRWQEGDVIGCFVDMDEGVVSFTLNGKGEEIGMGRAFSGEGFRPCGGVYACVSFNRREKLRLILGGPSSEPFKYPPPDGYAGVGKAVLDCVNERDLFVSEESVLDSIPSVHSLSSQTGSDARKMFLCDFSDGEHGHELMAWAHRYYGSDASVHLGSGRPKQGGSNQKTSSSSPDIGETSAQVFLSRRVEARWSKSSEEAFQQPAIDAGILATSMAKGYVETAIGLHTQLEIESMVLASMCAKKLLLHVLISCGETFDPESFVPFDSPSLESCLHLWSVIESVCSLRSSGWVGEAGIMAMAAEALGLGISSNDNNGSRLTGLASLEDFDEGAASASGGICQVLTAVRQVSSVNAVPLSASFSASAEAAIGSEGIGALAFVRLGLEAALCHSKLFRRIVLAYIRRSIRLLSVVEYDGEDSSPSESKESDDEEKQPDKPADDLQTQPDARLISFLTGLLLSPKAEATIEAHSFTVKGPLFEAWSVGLLSASLPWRMVCAFTAAGILNTYPEALVGVVEKYPTMRRFYGRLRNTTARRAWAERAALPVCSRYVQSMFELLASVKSAVRMFSFPSNFMKYWNKRVVDAATPLPLPKSFAPEEMDIEANWEVDDGWATSDDDWEVWTGIVEMKAVDWETPSRSGVRSLMDGGDGPPMLREGCIVVRGPDWTTGTNNGNEDGKDLYDAEKAKKEAEKRSKNPPSEMSSATNDCEYVSPEAGVAGETNPADGELKDDTPKSEEKSSKRKKLPSPKLPVGTVVAVEPWGGIPAMGRRVRWHLTGKEGVYRYGGDGGRYDINHVEVNEKSTRVKKRFPVPESAEQCASRHGFGCGKRFNVLLRSRFLRRHRAYARSKEQLEFTFQGVLEWPDFGAGILVDCVSKQDGSVAVMEREPLFGSKDSGWESRFGQPSFVPGTEYVLKPVSKYSEVDCEATARDPYESMYQEMVGSVTYNVPVLRNRQDGSSLTISSEMRMMRGVEKPPKGLEAQVSSTLLPPLHFDNEFHAPSLALSSDGQTVSCISSDGRGTAFASMGFTKGVHYWEVKLEQADIGSVFVGVAEKPSGSGSGNLESTPRLNKWHGWGFVNFRATYTAGAERIYGAHCHGGDTVGVLLDCDSGRVSFFYDGLKYGEHILNDLGCAFENLSPFGFNVDGCGGGGAGQGAPSGVEGGRSGRYPAQGAVRPRALWPVVGLRTQGDRVTFSPKWNTSYGVDGVTVVDNTLAFDEVIRSYQPNVSKGNIPVKFPEWFLKEAFNEYHRWKGTLWKRSVTRGSGPYHLANQGLCVDFDTNPLICASASASLGLRQALLPGDKVRLKRSAGRILELAEEAVVLGVFQGRLYYKIVSQKSEGGSLTEGGGRAWCWDESEVVDGLDFLEEPKGRGVDLPLPDRFRCTANGGLKVVYDGGAVVRSDLEIFDGSMSLGTIPCGTILPPEDVLERRVSSCGVVRYRVLYQSTEGVVKGWVSGRIRVGREEKILLPIHDPSKLNNDTTTPRTPYECALSWKRTFDTSNKLLNNRNVVEYEIGDLQTFMSFVEKGVVPGLSDSNSDAKLIHAIGLVCDQIGSEPLEVPFAKLSTAITFALASARGELVDVPSGSAILNQVAATAFGSLGPQLPSAKAILSRVAVLRAFNRRAKYALPWLSLRPCPEGSAIFGGYYGLGASIERAGRHSGNSQNDWITVPTIGSMVRSSRGLLFNSIKRELVFAITNVTTTPTPLSHDEYELPREIRTVRLNRLKARRVMAMSPNALKRKHSVFAQIQSETKSWGGAALRRGFVAKGHGGQKRAFKVKLIGEGVNDYSGPYREAFTDACAELLSVDSIGRGCLGVLDPTPNASVGIGENRGMYMFSLNGKDVNKAPRDDAKRTTPEEERLHELFASLTVPRDEARREVEDSLVFLGRITGTAFRHGIPLELPLPLESVWRMIVEEPTTRQARLEEIDILATRQTDRSSPDSLLMWQKRMLNSFVEGLSNVLPIEVFTLFTGEELRDAICGNPEVDVELLRRVVEYEGFEESDEVIQFFWETLREFTHEERKSFLQFVWARNRLPTKESEFDAPFKIMKESAKANGEVALPSASTCFFTLLLPPYSSKEQLKEKLLFAINNVTTMETDFQTNSAEIAEGYRAI